MQHRRDVLKMIEDPNGIPKSKVASHFSSDGHDVSDMRVGAFKYVLDEGRRKIEEDRLIAHLGSYRGEGMNTEFNYLHVI